MRLSFLKPIDEILTCITNHFIHFFSGSYIYLFKKLDKD